MLAQSSLIQAVHTLAISQAILPPCMHWTRHSRQLLARSEMVLDLELLKHFCGSIEIRSSTGADLAAGDAVLEEGRASDGVQAAEPAGR